MYLQCRSERSRHSHRRHRPREHSKRHRNRGSEPDDSAGLYEDC